jgi:hypothetical protein
MFALADVNSFYASCEKFSGRICGKPSSFSVTTMAALLPGVLIMWNCK